MERLTWKDFGLKDNPFGVTPPAKGSSIVWAELKDHKKRIEQRIRMAHFQTSSRLFVFYGEWGSGKTHVARYFTSKPYLDELTEEQELNSNPVAINIILPRSEVFKEIYSDIIREIGIDRLQAAVRFVLSQLKDGGLPKEAEAVAELGRIAGDDRLAQVLSLLREDEKKIQVEKYLLGLESAKDLDALGVPSGIGTTSHKLATLTGIFRILTTKTPNMKDGHPFSPKVWLWIDEVENISDLTGKDLTTTRRFLRDILDYMPSNMLIVLNFTLFGNSNIQDLSQFIGEPVSSRVHEFLRFYEKDLWLSKAQAMEFVHDMLNSGSNRAAGTDTLEVVSGNSYFPFDEKTVEETVKNITLRQKKSLTPRDVSTVFSSALDYALMDDGVKSRLKAGQVPITMEFVTRKKTEIFGQPNPEPEIAKPLSSFDQA